MDKVDYLIVGQGIAGTILGMELLDAGKSIIIVNHEKPHTSSVKAGGLYNPITGRMMVKTWLADELFADLEAFYQRLEKKLNARFIFPKSIYRPFFNYAEQNDWEAKASEPEFVAFIEKLLTRSAGIPHVKDEFGGLMLKNCGHVELPVMLTEARRYFQERNIYSNEEFDFEKLTVDGQIYYKDIQAGKVIFCDGPDVSKNPFWKELPFKPVKGETVQIKTALPEDMIINRGVFILPKNGFHTVGATYDHQRLDHEPSESGIQNLKDRLNKVYDGEYEIISSSAGVRPATHDRRPFVGFDPKLPQVGIFNGFGTKGVSLVPYFATQLVNYLKGEGEIQPEVDVMRVIK